MDPHRYWEPSDMPLHDPYELVYPPTEEEYGDEWLRDWGEWPYVQ